MFNSGPQNSMKIESKNLKSKSDLVLKLYLTEEQKSWVERLANDEQEPMSKCIAKLIDAYRDQRGRDQKLDKMQTELEDLKTNQKLLLSNSTSQLEIILAYVKEIFRESSANLYRLNSMIDEFKDSESVRADVNEYVRKQESAMRLRAIQIQEANL
jgi:hypothetical protein